jgi:hypothetical protein
MGHELLAATEDVQLLDTTNGPLTVTLLMLTAELLPLERVKVNHAVPVPTGVLPKLLLEGLRVRVWAMSVNGASNETATRVSMRLETELIRMLLCLYLQFLSSADVTHIDPPAVLGDWGNGGAQAEAASGSLGEVFTRI